MSIKDLLSQASPATGRNAENFNPKTTETSAVSLRLWDEVQPVAYDPNGPSAQLVCKSGGTQIWVNPPLPAIPYQLGAGGGGGAPTTATYLTRDNETGVLPNSKQVFNDATETMSINYNGSLVPQIVATQESVIVGSGNGVGLPAIAVKQTTCFGSGNLNFVQSSTPLEDMTIVGADNYSVVTIDGTKNTKSVCVGYFNQNIFPTVNPTIEQERCIIVGSDNVVDGTRAFCIGSENNLAPTPNAGANVSISNSTVFGSQNSLTIGGAAGNREWSNLVVVGNGNTIQATTVDPVVNNVTVLCSGTTISNSNQCIIGGTDPAQQQILNINCADIETATVNIGSIIQGGNPVCAVNLSQPTAPLDILTPFAQELVVFQQGGQDLYLFRGAGTPQIAKVLTSSSTLGELGNTTASLDEPAVTAGSSLVFNSDLLPAGKWEGSKRPLFEADMIVTTLGALPYTNRLHFDNSTTPLQLTFSASDANGSPIGEDINEVQSATRWPNAQWLISGRRDGFGFLLKSNTPTAVAPDNWRFDIVEGDSTWGTFPEGERVRVQIQLETNPPLALEGGDYEVGDGSGGLREVAQPLLTNQYRYVGNDVPLASINPGEFSLLSDGSLGVDIPTSIVLSNLDMNGQAPFYVLGWFTQERTELIGWSLKGLPSTGYAGGFTTTITSDNSTQAVNGFEITLVQSNQPYTGLVANPNPVTFQAQFQQAPFQTLNSSTAKYQFNAGLVPGVGEFVYDGTRFIFSNLSFDGNDIVREISARFTALSTNLSYTAPNTINFWLCYSGQIQGGETERMLCSGTALVGQTVEIYPASANTQYPLLNTVSSLPSGGLFWVSLEMCDPTYTCLLESSISAGNIQSLGSLMASVSDPVLIANPPAGTRTAWTPALSFGEYLYQFSASDSDAQTVLGQCYYESLPLNYWRFCYHSMCDVSGGAPTIPSYLWGDLVGLPLKLTWCRNDQVVSYQAVVVAAVLDVTSVTLEVDTVVPFTPNLGGLMKLSLNSSVQASAQLTGGTFAYASLAWEAINSTLWTGSTVALDSPTYGLTWDATAFNFTVKTGVGSRRYKYRLYVSFSTGALSGDNVTVDLRASKNGTGQSTVSRMVYGENNAVTAILGGCQILTGYVTLTDADVLSFEVQTTYSATASIGINDARLSLKEIN